MMFTDVDLLCLFCFAGMVLSLQWLQLIISELVWYSLAEVLCCTLSNTKQLCFVLLKEKWWMLLSHKLTKYESNLLIKLCNKYYCSSTVFVLINSCTCCFKNVSGCLSLIQYCYHLYVFSCFLFAGWALYRNRPHVLFYFSPCKFPIINVFFVMSVIFMFSVWYTVITCIFKTLVSV